MRRKKVKFLCRGIINVVLPMLVGAIFYYLYCPNVSFVRFIDRFIPKPLHLRIGTSETFLRILRNHGIDFFWGYSLSFLFFLLVILTAEKSNEIRQLSPAYLPLAAAACCTPEVLELWTGGTFDFIDVAVLVASALISFLHIKLIGRNYS